MRSFDAFALAAVLSCAGLSLSACKKEVPSLEEHEEGPQCAALDDPARDAIKQIAVDAFDVVFNHDVATYCRVYTEDSVEISGRAAAPDAYDLSLPFSTNVRYHALREGTRTRIVPAWSVALTELEGDACEAEAQGTVDLTFPESSQQLGFRASLTNQAGRWRIKQQRWWTVLERDADGSEVLFNAEHLAKLDETVKRVQASGGNQLELISALWDARRDREAYEAVVAASESAPEDFGLLLQRSILASSVGELDDLVAAFQRMRELSRQGGQELPQHVGQTLANIDARGVDFRGCPPLEESSRPVDDGAP